MFTYDFGESFGKEKWTKINCAAARYTTISKRFIYRKKMLILSSFINTITGVFPTGKHLNLDSGKLSKLFKSDRNITNYKIINWNQTFSDIWNTLILRWHNRLENIPEIFQKYNPFWNYMLYYIYDMMSQASAYVFSSKPNNFYSALVRICGPSFIKRSQKCSYVLSYEGNLGCV